MGRGCGETIDSNKYIIRQHLTSIILPAPETLNRKKHTKNLKTKIHIKTDNKFSLFLSSVCLSVSFSVCLSVSLSVCLYTLSMQNSSNWLLGIFKTPYSFAGPKDASPLVYSDFDGQMLFVGALPKSRRRRKFTVQQLRILKTEFLSSPYITEKKRKELAKSLELPESSIQVSSANCTHHLKACLMF